MCPSQRPKRTHLHAGAAAQRARPTRVPPLESHDQPHLCTRAPVGVAKGSTSAPHSVPCSALPEHPRASLLLTILPAKLTSMKGSTKFFLLLSKPKSCFTLSITASSTREEDTLVTHCPPAAPPPKPRPSACPSPGALGKERDAEDPAQPRDSRREGAQEGGSPETLPHPAPPQLVH